MINGYFYVVSDLLGMHLKYYIYYSQLIKLQINNLKLSMSNITNAIDPFHQSPVRNRFFICSLSLQIIFALIFIGLFIKQLVHFIKRRTQDRDENVQAASQNGMTLRDPENKQITTYMKLKRKSDTFFMKLSIIGVLALNVVMIAAYEYLLISGVIGIILLLIVSCVSVQNPIISLILEASPILFVLSWFINMYTIDRKDIF